ncbi:MAG: response regulator, partial [Betaproteobacteria bacterium]|nr:response regulator [Betaproteobacteria bacterium]
RFESLQVTRSDIPQPATISAGATAPAAEPSPVANLPTVMVVDDSLTVRKITSRMLAREGYHVLTAKDGVDALEQMIDTLPDVLLVDIEMPRMDGFDLTRNVRADERLKSIPIIMITSRTAEKHRTYAFEIGVNHYLGKPFQEDELLELVQGFVARRHQH